LLLLSLRSSPHLLLELSGGHVCELGNSKVRGREVTVLVLDAPKGGLEVGPPRGVLLVIAVNLVELGLEGGEHFVYEFGGELDRVGEG